MTEIKPVFYVDATTLRCRTMDDISDESVLYYRRGDKVHETDVALYPKSAIEALQKELKQAKEESQNYENATRIVQEWNGQMMLANGELRVANTAQEKRISELESKCQESLVVHADKNLVIFGSKESIHAMNGLALEAMELREDVAAQAKRIAELEAAAKVVIQYADDVGDDSVEIDQLRSVMMPASKNGG